MTTAGDNPNLGAAPASIAMPMAEEGELDLRRLADSLWGGRWIVLGFALLGVLAASAFLVYARPVFVATGLVQVEEGKQGGSRPTDDLSYIFSGGSKTAAEIEILKSRTVLGKVVEKLGLEISAEPRYLPWLGRFWARHLPAAVSEDVWWRWLKPFAWGDERIEVSVLNVPPSLMGESLKLIATDKGFELLDSSGDRILEGVVGTIAKGQVGSETVEILVDDLYAVPGCWFKLKRQNSQSAFGKLAAKLKVEEQGRQSGVIGISMQDHSPATAQAIVRTVEDVYLVQNIEQRSAEARQSLDFLQAQLPEIKEKVDAAQTQLNAYQVKQESVDVGKETDLILQQSVALESRRFELQQRRQEALQRFTTEHPIIAALDAQIDNVDRELGGIRRQSETLPAKQQEILSLLRDLEINSQLYTSLLNSMRELQVAKAGTSGNVRVIDYPVLPTSKSKPNDKIVLAIGLIVGLAIGVSIIFVLLALDQGISDASQVERAVGLTSYAAIPYSPAQARLTRNLKRGKKGAYILADLDPTNVAVEAMRSLRTSLQLAMMESPNNVLMLTGPTPNVGKSFVSINLGAVLAAAGKKVAVVDADLREGGLHRYCHLEQTPGITDFIMGRAEASRIALKTGVANLTLFARGTEASNPAELLLHYRFSELIALLSEHYDYVLLDAPPVLPVTDAGVIGALAGCTFLVLKDREHPMRAIKESVRRLHHAGVNPRGVIFNQLRRTAGSQGYRDYGSYRYDRKYSSAGS
ncbi:MAG: polysaccharide biosynthesis tyrosine autokinase [Panacagrimonas sp.]